MYAFPLKTDDEVRAAEDLRAETLKLDDYKDLEDMLGGKTEEIKNSRDDLVTGMDEARRKALNDEEEDEKKQDNSNIDEPRTPDRNLSTHKGNMIGDDVENQIDNEAFFRSLGTQAYIDFQEFCKLLAIFNPRYNLDEKVKFYFRIFDYDQDKKITDDDLNRVIDLMFGNAEDEGAGFPEEDKKHLIDKLMQEADTGQKEYLDIDDIEKILWATNIEQRCSMTFFMS